MMSTSLPASSGPSAQTTATPAMRQYLDAKRQYRDAILFFRMGDFYEMFYEDALTASRALELALTSRSKDHTGSAIPMCGVPYHAADGYIARLVKKGFRVALCEQVEDARKAKGLVRREVVRVVSPGTLTDGAYLDAREPAYLMALAPVTGQRGGPPTLGVALLDLSTGQFLAAEYGGESGRQALADEMAVLRPRELLIPAGSELRTLLPELAESSPRVTPVDPAAFDSETAGHVLCEQLRTDALTGFGLDEHGAAVSAAGALVQYLRDTRHGTLEHIRSVQLQRAVECLLVDAPTLRHLAVIESADGTRTGSLLHELDRTVTPMGGRLLREWLLRPLVSIERIQDRLDAVEDFAFRTIDRARVRETLKSVHDVERLVARTALGTAGPRDLVALRTSLTAIPRIRLLLEEFKAPLARSLVAGLDDLADVRDDIAAALVDEPPALARDGGCIRDGHDAEIDELRSLSRSARQRLADMELEERARTGIGSLKIRFNRVFGYYIEVSRANLHAVPADYHRKQTIAGGERFITPALKDYEDRILGADERLLVREQELFEAVRTRVAREAGRIQDSARALAALDVLAAFAEASALHNYTKPHVHAGDELEAADVRHPIVERHCRDAFVPNDVRLDNASSQLVILTGPNMGGKSTFLRQTALLCLMAQAGSFVAARQAKLPIVDRIFARVGASDNIAHGQSTFMVEMQETARILHAVTSGSLVVLDEIGRGTATFDGLSIAWAVAEHLATHDRARPKTLFATHYHELTDLADGLPGVVNYHVAAREWQDDIVFLRKVLPGRSDRSYGIQVARLAGLPRAVILRAQEILAALERDELSRSGRPSVSPTPTEPQRQLGLFQASSATEGQQLVERLRAIDPDRMTPLEALTLLAELKRKAEG
jgi:DNA mismatch repair protein MutS